MQVGIRLKGVLCSKSTSGTYLTLFRKCGSDIQGSPNKCRYLEIAESAGLASADRQRGIGTVPKGQISSAANRDQGVEFMAPR